MASSDVEMLSGDGEERAISAHDTTLPPQSPSVSATSSRVTPSRTDNNNIINNSNTIHIGDDNEIQAALVADAGDDNISKPPTAAASPAASGHKPPSSKPPSSKANSAKPRSSRLHKPRSPSPTPPPPPPPAPPLQTIRLEIKLGGPNNYAVDIADIARSTGQRPLTPTRQPGAGPLSDSEEDDEDGEKGAKGKEKAKIKKKVSGNSSHHHIHTNSLTRRRIHHRSTTMSTTPSSTTQNSLSMNGRILHRRSSKGSTCPAARSP